MGDGSVPRFVRVSRRRAAPRVRLIVARRGREAHRGAPCVDREAFLASACGAARTKDAYRRSRRRRACIPAFDVDKPGKVKLLKDKSGIDPSGLGTNPSGLKLKYKMKDATFSGTFTAYSLAGGKLKKTRVQVSGVVLGGKGYGTAAIKKVGSTVVNIR